MMDQNKNKRSFTTREEFRMLVRAVKTIHEIMPGYWLYSMLSLTAETILPYWSLYLSAEIINELSGGCDLRRLIMLVALTVGGGFLLSTLAQFFQSRMKIPEANNLSSFNTLILNAQNHFEYRHLEDPEVELKRGKIFAVLNAFGGGLRDVCYTLPEFIRSMLHLIISVVLTIPLFTMTLPGGHGFIHSPISSILIIALAR